MAPEVLVVHRNGHNGASADAGKEQLFEEIRPGDSLRRAVDELFETIEEFNPIVVVGQIFSLTYSKPLPEELIRVIGMRALYGVRLDYPYLDFLESESARRSFWLEFSPIVGMAKLGQIQRIDVIDGYAPTIQLRTAGQPNYKFKAKDILEVANWSLGFIEGEVSSTYPESWYRKSVS